MSARKRLKQEYEEFKMGLKESYGKAKEESRKVPGKINYVYAQTQGKFQKKSKGKGKGRRGERYGEYSGWDRDYYF